MKGILKKTVAGWFVWQSDKITSHFRSYPLHPNDAKICNQYGDYSMDWIDKEVEFEIVKEYVDKHTNMIQNYAKLNQEYKTNNL